MTEWNGLPDLNFSNKILFASHCQRQIFYMNIKLLIGGIGHTWYNNALRQRSNIVSILSHLRTCICFGYSSKEKGTVVNWSPFGGQLDLLPRALARFTWSTQKFAWEHLAESERQVQLPHLKWFLFVMSNVVVWIYNDQVFNCRGSSKKLGWKYAGVFHCGSPRTQ